MIEFEKEVKVLRNDIKKIEEKLINYGAEFLSEERQLNIRIDSSDGKKRVKEGCFLRIRDTHELCENKKQTFLTFKEISKVIVEGKSYRNNIEYTTEISDVDTMITIFKKLGFDKFVYENKHRKSYSYKNTRIDLDIWDEKVFPKPYFEIEFKKEEDLSDVLESLEINREDVSDKTLMELKELYDRGMLDV